MLDDWIAKGNYFFGILIFYNAHFVDREKNMYASS